MLVVAHGDDRVEVTAPKAGVVPHSLPQALEIPVLHENAEPERSEPLDPDPESLDPDPESLEPSPDPDVESPPWSSTMPTGVDSPPPPPVPVAPWAPVVEPPRSSGVLRPGVGERSPGPPVTET